MAKLRVHELAKELGITSKELLTHLRENGEFVKASGSTLEPPVVRTVREHYAAAAPKKADAAAKKKPSPRKPGPSVPAAPKKTEAAPTPSAGATAPHEGGAHATSEKPHAPGRPHPGEHHEAGT
ncbi:translation initiation factor IF-2 N-terminal domain-containing protein, partial [Actinomyces polynesiensis]|uniref:translation initiation factor IF-2 N-terminal domain-containing protein n=1 Tax=Actinomyces polynesiensis TaxID=1325934 RepID=UPI0005BD7546